MEQAMIMGDDQRLIQLMIVNKYQFTEITAMLELLHEIKKTGTDSDQFLPMLVASEY